MKYLFIILFLFTACNSNKSGRQHSARQNKIDTIIVHDTITREKTIYQSPVNDDGWQEGFGLTHDPNVDSIWFKPVSYYLDDPKCVPIAFEFYYGYFRPTDNGATTELLKYATSDNKKLRPFYRWCLNKTIQVSDGALAELVGEPALNYAIKFPKEFFEYMDEDTSGNRYKAWMSEISYSGFDSGDSKSVPGQVKRAIATMRSNCKNCDNAILKRIDKFAKDCY